jgi:glyoxylase-like metal-dependent hydrolase (beta-lactamase superfamily II)
MKSSTHGPHLTKVTRLVDTALAGSAKGILAAADALGAPIVRIVLTHTHQDHAGSLDKLVAAIPGVEVSIGSREARLLAGDRTMDPGEPPLKGSFVHAQTVPQVLLAPGDRVGSLEVFAAPGHTPGQIALLDTRDRTLIGADAYSTLGRVATTAKPTLPFPLPAIASWHRPTALVSARELRGLDPARLAVGHGPVLEAPGEAMDRALKDAGA